jgi:hypothetical protein
MSKLIVADLCTVKGLTQQGVDLLSNYFEDCGNNPPWDALLCEIGIENAKTILEFNELPVFILEAIMDAIEKYNENIERQLKARPPKICV